eukprot:TRINITY_DN2251_c0_g2_i1.p1 TRINITY_DN2251_c0_g2~~TRINITY_DN2251_c0_g2_i1.p1  ORF type:complete len:613 (-),score=171.91 TRINITY_DN2251_c0_g2_i1:55-1869(-)
MRGLLVLSLLVGLIALPETVECRAPIWKVFCSGQPLFRGRIDPIVNPGGVATHTHKVAGGNHFSAAGTTQTALEVFQDQYSSTCTTCSIGKIDMSAYWHPDLYYQWPNNTFSLVPDGGLTVYYLSRAGSGNQSDPDWQPIPKGLRMLAGDAMRRSFSGSLEDRAVNYACLSSIKSPPREPNLFPTNNYTCDNGLRAQVFFPMCWDGVNLDSPNHKSHMAYPSGVDGGNCPDTHPVRIPGIFFEAFYSLKGFPHGQGFNPFVWSNGDPTGYGFHGDFLSGWNPDVMREALADPACDNGNPNMAFGNNVKACPPLAPYVQDTPQGGVCNLENPIPLTEDVGLGAPIAKLPGCNPLSYGPAPGAMCNSAPSDSYVAPVTQRFLLKSKNSGTYVSTPSNGKSGLFLTSSKPTLFEIWNSQKFASGVYLRNEGSTQYVSANGPDAQLFANRGAPDSYEGFNLISSPDSTNVKIQSNRTKNYVGIKGGLLFPNVTLADADIFQLEIPNGGDVGIIVGNIPQFSDTVGFIPTGSWPGSSTKSPTYRSSSSWDGIDTRGTSNIPTRVTSQSSQPRPSSQNSQGSQDSTENLMSRSVVVEISVVLASVCVLLM